MTAQPARHRNDASTNASAFWAARELLADGQSSGRPRHARKTTSKYATHVGRVGALAVSLGIGFAVANSATPVAYAETDTDSGASSSAPATSESASTARADSTKPSVRTGPRTRAERAETRSRSATNPRNADDVDEILGNDTDDVEASGADDADEPSTATSGGSTRTTPDEAEETTAEVTAPATDQTDPAPTADVDTDDTAEPDDTEPNDTTAEAPTETTTVREALPRRAAVRAAAYAPVASPARVAQEITETNVVGAVVSSIITPLVDTEAPVSNPITDAVLAYVRRLINHTFFNKTPVVRSVTTEQIVTGQVVIDIDAYDPNGDPLTYEIVQPEGGFVFREVLTGKFVYTPTTVVTGDPRPVEFQIIIRDDSEHLPGALGGIQNLLHAVARIFGLAEADNYTQTVSFDVGPILQAPPVLVAVGSLPYELGGDPTKLLSVAEIVDVDSQSLKRAVLKFTVGDVDGDVLHFADTDQITGSWDADTRTLTLEGDASLAAYEAALKAVTFSATSLGLLARTVSITLVDEHNMSTLVPATVVAAVLPGVVLPPALVATPGLPYRIGDAPRRLLSIAEIADGDSANLSRVVLRIVGAQSGDLLEFSAPEGSPIQGHWDAENHTLTLENVASKAAYEAALKAVDFSATQVGLLSRTIEINLTDESGTANLLPAMVVIGVVAIPELPLTIVPVGAPFYTLGKRPVRVASSVSIVNADNDTLNGATITISVARMDGDKLTYTGPDSPNITVTQTNDYTLTLSGEASVEEYQQVFKEIGFSATQLGLTRTVAFTATEVDGDDTLLPGLVFVNTLLPLAPTVTAPSLVPSAYTLGKRATRLAPTVLIGDLDSTHLTKATLEIVANKQTGDTLSYTEIAGNPITATWDGTTLTLQGTATIEQYRAALEAVTFEATGGVGLLQTRLVQIHVTDDSGERSLIPATAEVLVKNPDRPTLVVTPPLLSFPKANETVRPIASATIFDTDSTVLHGASVKITDGFTNGDALAFNGLADNPITASYDSATRELKLTGEATLAQYKAALEAVTFRATQHGAGFLALFKTRTLTVNISDDSGLNSLLPGIVLVTVYK